MKAFTAALIIDDSPMKQNEIEKVLKDLGITVVDHAGARNEGLCKINDSYEDNSLYDFLVLDMQFPVFAGGYPDAEAGIDVLMEIERLGLPVPVIVCSSDVTDCKDRFENVIADIQYDSSVSLESEFGSVLKANGILP